MSAVEALPQLKCCKIRECANIAISWDGYCKGHAGRRGLRSYSSRPRTTSPRRVIGVELEMFNAESVYHLTPVARYVCHDGSLTVLGAGEVKLCSTVDRISSIAADTAQRARIAGADVNTKCGFHVHLSLPPAWFACPMEYEARNRMRNNLKDFAVAIEEMVFAIMPPSRTSNKYCQRIEKAGMNSHHSWCSLSTSVPTVEIRIHGGTTNPWKVKAWVEFCIALRARMHAVIEGVLTPEEAVPKNSLSELCPTGSLAERYIKAREKSPVLEKFMF